MGGGKDGGEERGREREREKEKHLLLSIRTAKFNKEHHTYKVVESRKERKSKEVGGGGFSMQFDSAGGRITLCLEL